MTVAHELAANQPFFWKRHPPIKCCCRVGWVKISNNQQGATMNNKTNRLFTPEVRESSGDEAVAGVKAIFQNND